LDYRRPSVLVAAAKWWSLSARLASGLLRKGCRVSAICPKGHPLERLSGLENVEPYRGLASLQSLSRALKAVRPDVVVPCDDGVVAQLHTLHQRDDSLAPLIERSLGDPQSFKVVRSRFALLGVAAELGIPVPETRRVQNREHLALWHERIDGTAVLKVDGESGGNGVRFCTTLQESICAFDKLNLPYGLATGCKRMAIDRDPLALWSSLTRGNPEITIQRFIPGRPANCMAICRDGELLSVVTALVLTTDGPTGAATIIRQTNDEGMAYAAKQLAKRLRLSGFFGLDFIVEAGSQTPHLIELNPRCTQLGHLEFSHQASLAAVFSADLRGEAPPAPSNPTPLGTIALYPQALRAKASRYREDSYLDVPWDEPALMAELKLDPWPQRRWAARLYHAFRPVNAAGAVEYDDLRVGGQPVPAPIELWRPHGDSNPGYIRERDVS
jgi:ATP-grasp domain